LSAPAHFLARGNEFAFRSALFSFDGYPDKDDWRRSTTWAGRDNRYPSSGPSLRLEGAPAADTVRFER
jgi:hypothetical protein